MVFSSFTFVFGFLPIFLACYALSPARGKNFVISPFIDHASLAPEPNESTPADLEA